MRQGSAGSYKRARQGLITGLGTHLGQFAQQCVVPPRVGVRRGPASVGAERVVDGHGEVSAAALGGEARERGVDGGPDLGCPVMRGGGWIEIRESWY